MVDEVRAADLQDDSEVAYIVTAAAVTALDVVVGWFNFVLSPLNLSRLVFILCFLVESELKRKCSWLEICIMWMGVVKVNIFNYAKTAFQVFKLWTWKGREIQQIN